MDIVKGANLGGGYSEWVREGEGMSAHKYCLRSFYVDDTFIVV